MRNKDRDKNFLPFSRMCCMMLGFWFCFVWFGIFWFPSIEGFCLKLVLTITNEQRFKLFVVCLMSICMYVMFTCMLI
jgi:hypothetical protein